MQHPESGASQPGALVPDREWRNRPAEPARRSAIAADDLGGDGPDTSPVQGVQLPPAPRRTARGQAIRRRLASPASLRLAVLMAEILAPPKALRLDDH